MFGKMHMNKFLLQAEDCAVMVIDIQEKLFAAMDERFRSMLIRNCRILIEASQTLDMPIVVTEQYPWVWGPSRDRRAYPRHLPL